MKCEKCNYESPNEEEFQKRYGIELCNVCLAFAPKNPEDLDEYIEEKVINHEELKPFRKYAQLKSQTLKTGMIKKARQGELMSRAPFGYQTEGKKLVPAPNYKEVEEIFEEFLNENISLRKLAAKHSLSVNGLKKILKNFTYMGKIKFNNQIYNGNHQPIISSTLFNHVQNKLEKLGVK